MQKRKHDRTRTVFYRLTDGEGNYYIQSELDGKYLKRVYTRDKSRAWWTLDQYEALTVGWELKLLVECAVINE